MRSVLNYIRRQWIARPLTVFSVCFLFGICFCAGNSIPLAVLAASACLIFAAHHILKSHRISWYVLPMIAAFLLGGARMQAEYMFNPAVPEMFSVSFEGIVASDPYYNAESERIICCLRVTELDGMPAKYEVRLYLRDEESDLSDIRIEYGQRLQCFGHVWPQDSATNPYEYDAMNALRADGLDGMAAAQLKDVSVFPSRPSIGGIICRIRQSISDRIDLLFKENADLVRAFVLGDRTGLDRKLTDSFSKTGVSHLICISGLHISTVAAVVSKLLSRRFTHKTATLGTLTAVLLYGTLIGFPPSLIRAAVMFSVFSFAPLAGMPSDPITRLATALLGMLVCRPFYVFDGGFVLSFSASAGILLLTEPIEYLFRADGLRSMKPHPNRALRLVQRAVRYLPLLFCTTLAAQLATLPAVIAYFGSQPLISIPANMLAIPLAMIGYPLALLALIISAVLLPFGQVIAFAADGLFSALTASVDVLASLPFGSLRSAAYPKWLILLHCLLILLASGLNRIPVRIRRYLPLGLVLLLGVSLLNAWIHALGFTAIFLDADQADASVIKAEGHVYICDTGDLYSPVTDYVTGICLGVDAVFLSHPHQDHAGGLAELVKEMPPKVIYVPEGWFEVEASPSVTDGIDAAIKKGIPIIELSSGDELHPSDNVSIYIHASSDRSASVNDLSMLMEVHYYNRSLFYTGDLSSEGEPDQPPDVDLLKVPHHGSDKASSERFLRKTSPEIAIVSVGDNNYGHPAPETLTRLISAGAEVYRTDECGAIEVRISKSGDFCIKTYLPMEESK